MDYNAFMRAVDLQVEKTSICKGYNAFKEDVNKLKQDNTGCGLSAITANVWLKKICEMSDSELFEYVERYRLGVLNAWEPYR